MTIPEKELPFVSIILPAYNESKYISECLMSLVTQSYPRDCFEIIVVDNGSEDDTLEIAKRYVDKALVLKEGNVGAVRNFGVTNAKGEILAFLDSDCRVDTNWLSHGVRKLISTPNSVIGGALTHSSVGANWIQKYWVLESVNSRGHQKELMGSCIFIFKSTFEKVDGFNERVTSGEDTELSIKLRQHGCIIDIDRDLKISHLDTPDTIKNFIMRQSWHSENYFIDIKNTLKDKMFFIVILYITLYFHLFYSLIAGYFFLGLIFHQIPPIALSIKRIKRSGYKVSSLFDLIKILLIDNFYLTGRSVGLVKGLIKAF